jgi:hypothetical protein
MSRQTNVHDEEQSGRPTICSEFKMLTKTFVEDEASRFQNFYVNFQKFHTPFFSRLSVTLGYHKFCARWVSKMLRGEHKMALAFTFLKQYHKDDNEFLNHII